MQSLLAALAIMAVAVLGTVLAPSGAAAQPCANITVCNYAPCPINLCLRDGAGVVWCFPVVANPGPIPPRPPFPPFPPPPPAGCPVFATPPGVIMTGVVSMGGFFYPFIANPLAPPPVWVPNVTVGPAGCCVDVYFNQATCQVWVYPSGGPPPCRP